VLDNDSFTQLMSLHKGTVFRLAYSHLRNRADAEDVVQDVFVKLYRHAGDFESDEHLRRWLIRVTVNECTSLWRALRRRSEDIEEYVATLPAPSQDPAPDTPRPRNLLREVLKLPERYRVPVYLYYYEGYSSREVAALLGLPEATVRTRLARGRAKLKAVLEIREDQ